MRPSWLLAIGAIVLVTTAACAGTPSELPASATATVSNTQAVPTADTLATSATSASTTKTPRPYTYSPETYEAKLASCASDANGSTLQVRPTVRRFVVIPRAIYPDGHFVNVDGTAVAEYISNGGLPGWAVGSSADCWSTYYEFGGVGEVDFRAQSVVPGAPEYVIHFVVVVE